MIFIVHSAVNAATIKTSMGECDYSYYFVLKEYSAILKELGTVIFVSNPEEEVDRLYQEYLSRGQRCIFLSFTPPHKTLIDLKCPTIPVFAWEFDTLPSETWDENLKNDWSFVLKTLGCAITHSQYTIASIQQAIDVSYPVTCIPAPVWDRFALQAKLPWTRQTRVSIELDPTIAVIDTHKFNIPAHHPSYVNDGMTSILYKTVMTMAHSNYSGLELSGVTYTSVLNPCDGRKNVIDLLVGFCWAFRYRKDVTLVLKMAYMNRFDALVYAIEILSKMYPFYCRVVMIHGYLTDKDYEKLVQATTYVVNTSHGEGQCLPLMEFMSSGKPAIAPAHTAMQDYIDENNAFIVRSTPEPTFWPPDPRQAFRALRQRIDWESLLTAYNQSLDVALHEPERYTAMASNATERLRNHCQQALMKERLINFLNKNVFKQEEILKVS